MKTPVIFFVALFIWGCSSSTGGGDDLLPLVSKVVLDVRETHGQTNQLGTPQPTLLLETDKIYGCINYVIRLRVRTCPPTLDVEMLGVELPGDDICLTVAGPATARVDVPEISQYTNIILRYGSEVDRYTLVVDEESFHISGEPGDNSRIGDTLVWRFPQRSMVYTCGTLAEDSCLCTQFVDTLLERLKLRPIAVPEIGYWPYPRAMTGHYYDMPPLVYQYTDDSDFGSAGDALEAFTRSVLFNHHGVGLSLRNWRNESYASWLVSDSALAGY